MQNIQTKVINYNNTKKGLLNLFRSQRRFLIPLLFILSYILFYFIIDFSTQSLVAHDEGLYARRSRLLEESNNWFSPPFDNPHHKTLGSYWFISASIRLFGKSELALRFPSIITSFLCLLITYFIALKISNKKSALISVFSLSSMPLWIQYSRYASPDIVFVFCILIFILFFIKFLDASISINKYLYIFLSGFFISTSFFVRSYMAFVPLIALTPFVFYHLSRTKNIFKLCFSVGILIGSIPTILSLYYSYNKFGMTGITALFDFAKKQAIGTFDFNNYMLFSFNYLYLTFPIGILFIILIVFSRVNYNIKYPLLTYCYPLLSLLILLCMSTSYPHYYLFILPSLSILFAVNLQVYSIRFSLSRKLIKYFLLLIILFIASALASVVFLFYKSRLEYSYNNNLLVYFVSLILLISYINALRYLFYNNDSQINILRFLYKIIIPQYISLSLLYNFGVIGNPNFQTKSFLNDKYIASIVKTNTIYLYKVDSKIETLLSYYLPSSIVLNSIENINEYNYIITSDRSSLYDYQRNHVFKLIKNFNNNLLLMNISK